MEFSDFILRVLLKRTWLDELKANVQQTCAHELLNLI